MDKIIEELLKELDEPKIQISDVELKKSLYRELLRLTLLVDEDVSEPQIFGQMSGLVRKAKKLVNAETTAEKIDQLLNLVYREWGFSCRFDEYFHTENLLLNKVLSRKRGMPVSVGAVVLYLAAVLELPIFPVNFPTQLVLRAEIQDETGRQTVRYINPWDGSDLTMAQLEKWLVGEVGFGVTVTPDLIRRATPSELLERLETVFKMALTGEGNYEKVLRMIEYRLIFSPEDPYEIRDRGMVLASMDCYQAAYDDLSYFIDQCPEDPSAVMLKMEIAGLKKKSEMSVVH